MKRVPRTSQLLRSLILWPTMVLALSVSACGTKTEPVEAIPLAPEEEEPEDDEPCTLTDDSPPPTLSIGNDSTVTLQCHDAWEAPEVTATDGCGQPLEVYQYNTGDDDEDGIAGTIDPDDFGPGPDLNSEGVYYVQYIAWDPLYHISAVILTVNVMNCHD